MRSILREPIVITGIGLIASAGRTRESTWQAVRDGHSQFRRLRGLRGIPDDEFVGATVELDEPLHGRLKVLELCKRAAQEAVEDAGVSTSRIDAREFGCMVCTHVSDTRFLEDLGDGGHSASSPPNWWEQFFPSTACHAIADQLGCLGPRVAHSSACASSLTSVLQACAAIRDRQCDIAVAGGGDVIHPIYVAGFNQMRVLANDDNPSHACRPFDRSRKGFVFGEGAAMFVVERLGHALRRGATIYAEVAAGKTVAQAHHMTSIDAQSDALAYLISAALDQAGLSASEIGYINTHGTGTEQNDLAEATGIRASFGAAAQQVCLSATKSILGHMVGAAGAVELAITALALRDGFAPPTLNLNDPDPACGLDCLPLIGRSHRFQHAMKLSLAFGGHLVAVILNRWNDASTGFAYPSLAKAA